MDDIGMTYAELAEWCGRAPDARRIQSIDYLHDGVIWRATVGEPLRGTKTQRRRRGGKAVDVSTPVSDPATVLAIFPGTPYLVVTNGRPLTDLVSWWANPFMAGKPEVVRYFED